VTAHFEACNLLIPALLFGHFLRSLKDNNVTPKKCSADVKTFTNLFQWIILMSFGVEKYLKHLPLIYLLPFN